MKQTRSALGTAVKQMAENAGAAAVGISSVGRLTDKPSMDANYLLPGARSIVSVMLPLEDRVIRDYLGKTNRIGFQLHETETYRKLYAIGTEIADFMKAEKYRAVVAEPNLDYRYKDSTEYRKIPYQVRQNVLDWLASDSFYPVGKFKKAILPVLYDVSFKNSIDWELTPSFSHRYGAVAAGIGHFGWSGNVLHPDYGARVLYNTVITDCDMPSDPMLEKTPCDGCRICTKVCQSNFIHPKKKTSVTIGDRIFEHNKKAHNLRCIFVCAGFSGQNKHAGWSTWSPGRVNLPESDDALEARWKEFVKVNLWNRNHYSKVFADLLYHSEKGFIRKESERFASTCGNCQLVCWQTREMRRQNYDLIVNSWEVSGNDDFPSPVENG